MSWWVRSYPTHQLVLVGLANGAQGLPRQGSLSREGKDRDGEMGSILGLDLIT